MTPDNLLYKWEGAALSENQAFQQHVLDLRALVGVVSLATCRDDYPGCPSARQEPNP